VTKHLAFLRPHLWLPIVLVILSAAFYIVFNSGWVLTCMAGLIAAATFFWMKLRHRVWYGASEIAAGIYILSQDYAKGRGGFSSGFSDGFQTFKWNVVLIATLASVYVIVRGLDNIREGLKSGSY
jgi:hypothetical protein